MDDLSLLHSGGLFLRREALEHGYDDRDLRAALRDGVLVRVRHGAYVPSAVWSGADSEARHRLACRAVLLSHPSPIALSHVSGAVASGLRVWGSDLSKVHVVRLDEQTGRRSGDVVHHVGAWRDVGVDEVDGMKTLPPVACVIGLSGLNPVEAGIVAIDSAYDKGVCSPEEAAAVYERLGSWPGSRRVQISLRLAQPGSQSVGESRLRYLFWRGHLPKPVLQFPVVDQRGDLIGITDFAWPERGLLGEFDGRIKYEKLLQPGENPSDAVFREKVREDRLREATGWSMVRFVWADLAQPRRTVDRFRSVLDRHTR